MQTNVSFRFLDDVSVELPDDAQATIITADGTRHVVPANSLLYVVAYGLKQSSDDAGADPKKGAAGSQERLDALLAGKVPAGGGGGARLSAFEKAVRTVVQTYLRQIGVKAGDAEKQARKPEAAFREYIQARLSVQTKTPISGLDPERVERNYQKLWPEVERQAREMAALAEQAAGGPDLD